MNGFCWTWHRKSTGAMASFQFHHFSINFFSVPFFFHLWLVIFGVSFTIYLKFWHKAQHLFGLNYTPTGISSTEDTGTGTKIGYTYEPRLPVTHQCRITRLRSPSLYSYAVAGGVVFVCYRLCRLLLLAKAEGSRKHLEKPAELENPAEFSRIMSGNA